MRRKGAFLIEDCTVWFDQLYLENAPKMVRFAYYQLRSREVAEELTDEAFVLLLRKRSELEEHPNVAGWLWKTLEYLILNETKAARYRMEIPLEPDLPLAAPEETREDLREALPEGLSPGEREILILFYQEQLSHEEIASKLGISVLNSRTRLFRARNRCKNLMEKLQKG